MSLQKCLIRTNRDMREIQAHGTLDFPSAVYYSERGNTSPDAVSWHWHEEFEILYIKEGQCRVQVPGEEYTLKEEDTAVINSNTLHYIVGDPFFKLESFVFSPLLLTGTADSAFSRKYIRPVIDSAFKIWITKHECDRESFRKAYEAQKDESFAYEFTVRENLSRIMLSLYHDKEDTLTLSPAAKDADSERIEKMLDFIHTHYSENITLEDIASSAVLSTREALRCFGRTISDTPIQYLLKYRLMQSASLLKNSPALSIAEITSLCGFDYPCYFSKQFRRFYQCTPKEYRNS